MRELHLSIPHKFVKDKHLKELSHNALRVYICLKYHANWSSGLCWPTYNTIHIETGISSGNRIKEALLELKEHKLVEWELRYAIRRDGSEYGYKRHFYIVT